MGISISNISTYSIFLAALIGGIRFKEIGASYHPFVLLIWIAACNETLSMILIGQGHTTIVNNNLYVLVESLLITLFFKKQALFTRDALFPLLCSSFVLLWLAENFLIRTPGELNLYFNIFYSFAIVLMSIEMINRILVQRPKLPLWNSRFLISVAFITYFTFNVLIHSFWLYGLTSSRAFVVHLYFILIYINLFTNLIYAASLLWIPRKQPSLLPS